MDRKTLPEQKVQTLLPRGDTGPLRYNFLIKHLHPLERFLVTFADSDYK